MGRPSKYSDKVLQEICDRLSQGEPLAQICREDHMPSMTTVWNWQNKQEDKELAARVSEAIARAREEGEDVIAADCLSIADSPTSLTSFGGYDGGHIQEKKLRIETRLKLLAKWNPKRWGEKIDHTTAGNPIPAPVLMLAHDRPERQAD